MSPELIDAGVLSWGLCVPRNTQLLGLTYPMRVLATLALGTERGEQAVRH